MVRAHGLSVAHPRPLVSYGKDYGRVFYFRTSPRKAWRYAEVDYAVGHSGAALAIRAGTPVRLVLGIYVIQVARDPAVTSRR